MSKKNKVVIDKIKQSEDYIEFMRKALASENFKAAIKVDPKKATEYAKMQRKLEKEKLILKFLKLDNK